MVAAGQNMKRLIKHRLESFFRFPISPLPVWFPTHFDFFNSLEGCATNT
jgi:FPC/CPF motif-containing protein YcgG